jgi:hypothetical protein
MCRERRAAPDRLPSAYSAGRRRISTVKVTLAGEGILVHDRIAFEGE